MMKNMCHSFPFLFEIFLQRICAFASRAQTSMYHSLSYATIQYMQAMMTFDAVSVLLWTFLTGPGLPILPSSIRVSASALCDWYQWLFPVAMDPYVAPLQHSGKTRICFNRKNFQAQNQCWFTRFWKLISKGYLSWSEPSHVKRIIVEYFSD